MSFSWNNPSICLPHGPTIRDSIWAVFKTRCHYWLVENRIPHGSNRLVIFGEYDPRNNHPIGFLNTAHLIPPWFPKPPQRLSILVALCCVDFLWARESEAKADLMGNHWFTRGIGPIQKVPKPLIHDITHNIMINIVHHVLIFFPTFSYFLHFLTEFHGYIEGRRVAGFRTALLRALLPASGGDKSPWLEKWSSVPVTYLTQTVLILCIHNNYNIMHVVGYFMNITSVLKSQF